MATTVKETNEPVSSIVAEVKPAQVSNEPRVLIRIPKLPEDDSGMKIDQYEHVTVNGVTTLIKRGEAVEVTVPVFLQLRNKFKDI